MTEKTPRQIVKYPLLSEKAMDSIERENKLIFIVDEKSNKDKIGKAVEELYDVEVDNVNILNSPKGKKKAFVKLTADHDAMDLATDLQLI